MWARAGVILATWLVVLGGQAEQARAACVSVGDRQEASQASLLSLVESRVFPHDDGPAQGAATLVLRWWHVPTGHRQEWWIASTEGMSPPPSRGADVASPQVCALSSVPKMGGLQLVARLALQQQTSLPPRWPPAGSVLRDRGTRENPQ